MIYEIIPETINDPLWSKLSGEEIISLVIAHYMIYFDRECFIDERGEDLPMGLLNLKEEPKQFTDPYGVIIATFNPLQKEIK